VKLTNRQTNSENTSTPTEQKRPAKPSPSQLKGQSVSTNLVPDFLQYPVRPCSAMGIIDLRIDLKPKCRQSGNGTLPLEFLLIEPSSLALAERGSQPRSISRSREHRRIHPFRSRPLPRLSEKARPSLWNPARSQYHQAHVKEANRG